MGFVCTCTYIVQYWEFFSSGRGPPAGRQVGTVVRNRGLCAKLFSATWSGTGTDAECAPRTMAGRAEACLLKKERMDKRPFPIIPRPNCLSFPNIHTTHRPPYILSLKRALPALSLHALVTRACSTPSTIQISAHGFGSPLCTSLGHLENLCIGHQTRFTHSEYGSHPLLLRL